METNNLMEATTEISTPTGYIIGAIITVSILGF